MVSKTSKTRIDSIKIKKEVSGSNFLDLQKTR